MWFTWGEKRRKKSQKGKNKEENKEIDVMGMSWDILRCDWMMILVSFTTEMLCVWCICPMT
jgi:hypothetical protein